MVRVNYHYFGLGDRFYDMARDADDELRNKLIANPDFPFESATYDQIIDTFGHTYSSKYTLRIPKVIRYKGDKFYVDQWIYYFSVAPDLTIKKVANARDRSLLALAFYLYQGKVVKVFLIDETRREVTPRNSIFDHTLFHGHFHRFPENLTKEEKRTNSCLEYFYHVFSLCTTRGSDKVAGYEVGCDFDYDPEYWKDPIYQPIWNPKIMGTLEQLGIKEDHYP
ncbi:hypothetical protein LPTSP4_24680 [Leptospira ryugenii]|uniref:Uncharacterized protein n=2 Tax=Leptospira ryugenii TaxID=1917863 RepID=A0A2P2E252_9LEPT|nr:hypothetical protein LPTSP4_24680 [Leptospira ryugenii]